MASTVLQVRLDEGTCSQAAKIYDYYGIDLQKAVTLFLKRSIEDDDLAFETYLSGVTDPVSKRALQAMRSMQNRAEELGLSSMTLDEINAEIAAARAERRERERAAQQKHERAI